MEFNLREGQSLSIKYYLKTRKPLFFLNDFGDLNNIQKKQINHNKIIAHKMPIIASNMTFKTSIFKHFSSMFNSGVRLSVFEKKIFNERFFIEFDLMSLQLYNKFYLKDLFVEKTSLNQKNNLNVFGVCNLRINKECVKTQIFEIM